MQTKRKEQSPSEASITRTPFPGSEKAYVSVALNADNSVADSQMSVAMRRILLSSKDQENSEPQPSLLVYDTSGPYTDPDQEIDIRKGLPGLRSDWIEKREDSQAVEEPATEKAGFKNTAPAHLKFPAAPAPKRAKGLHKHHPASLCEERHYYCRNALYRRERKSAAGRTVG